MARNCQRGQVERRWEKAVEGVRRRVYLAHIWLDLAAEIRDASGEEARRRRVSRVALREKVREGFGRGGKVC